MESYFAMGGYAAFVWPAYAVTAVGLLGILLASVKGLRDAERRLAALEGGRALRRPATTTPERAR